jgi:hypothetical protein
LEWSEVESYFIELSKTNAKLKKEKLKRLMERERSGELKRGRGRPRKLEKPLIEGSSGSERRAEKQRTNPPTQSDSGVHSVSYARFDEKYI